jgi:periplasmic divalent cation tolerance protein
LISTIYITTSNELEAVKISTQLVKMHLVACANYFPIKSIYYWEGKLQKEHEYAVIFKTQRSKVNDVINTVKELHSYEVPCVEVYPVDKGHPDFFDWVVNETNL